MAENTLYYGDNEGVLKEYVDDESVDLVYLDPPFKSARNYNILFAERDGTQSAAQIKAFEDTWEWNLESEAAYRRIVESGGRVSEVMQAFRTFLGSSDMMAYLAMMAPRLVELHRVLKSTGSIWLHCDPTASHYLKMLMDAIFSPGNFRNEVVWKRTSAHSSAKRCGPVHDTLLYYTKSDTYTWNDLPQPFDQFYIDQFYTHIDSDQRRWSRSDLTGEGTREGPSGKPWRGIDVAAKGRHWRMLPSELDKLDAAGKIHWPEKEDGMPRLKMYLDKSGGMPLQDVWTDIRSIHNMSSERMGYPTQKPETLLERIILASSNTGDTVLDPFCGCGTAIAVAERLGRRWIGIDITHLAIALLKNRLHDSFGDGIKYTIVGEPVDLAGAEALAAQDPWQFQWWALSLVHARPADQKKGADKGIDGRIFFHDEGSGGKTKQAVLQVKAGRTDVTHIRDLRGVIEREKAAIGVLISMHESSKPMRKEAADAGFYDSPGWGTEHPRLQILTIEDLLGGKKINMPPSKQVNVTHKRAPRVKGKPSEAMGELFDKD